MPNPQAESPAPISEKPPELIKVHNLYQSSGKIQPLNLKGFYRSLRNWTWLPLLAIFFLTPWWQINGQQAVQFDLPARQFHIFGLTFWPQDFMYLSWLLIIAAFTLFTVTVLVGRVWCGFTCPQTVWTMLFVWAEELFEGNRRQRIALDKAPWNLSKLLRRAGSRTTWLLISFVTGFTFVAYFNPARELVEEFFTFSAHPAAYFWAALFTILTFINAGYLREQVCLYMCPYARFQSVMFDPNTLIVSYDNERGEKRGRRKKGSDYRTRGLGDCVDCKLCVQVCPTGIDIRDGLQYECISCGLCIDACNSVMDKLGYPRRLIGFTTENTLEHKKTRLLRPRFIGYLAALAIMIGLFGYDMINRIPMELDVIRDRNLLFRRIGDGQIENVYTLSISNKDNRDHTYRIAVDAEQNLVFLGESSISVAQGEIYTDVVRLRADPADLPSSNIDLYFEAISATDAAMKKRQVTRFISPR